MHKAMRKGSRMGIAIMMNDKLIKIKDNQGNIWSNDLQESNDRVILALYFCTGYTEVSCQLTTYDVNNIPSYHNKTFFVLNKYYRAIGALAISNDSQIATFI